ncbi:MAG: GDP-mannose 4,6-dehydratase [Planctomycetia bacterium]|nr:GDP-mannose 4,6-dehydratase [Planctomycetia bacterium]
MAGKKYLVTGGAGFIGSHLTGALLRQGHSVTVIDDLSTGRWSNIASYEGNPSFRVLVSKCEDVALMREEVSRCDFVFHLASAVGVQLIIDHPIETIQRIVRGTDVVIEECSKYRKPILLTSTSEVYGKSEQIPFREEDDIVMGPSSKRRWAYACAKVLDEFLVLAHYYQTSLPVFIVRLFNTVGPLQSSQYGMVLPRFVEQALQGQPITVYGTGEQRRCFSSVTDIVRGLTSVPLHPQAAGKVINLGNNEEISMNELADLVRTMSGSKSEIVHIPYEKAYGPGFDDMQRRIPSLDRAKEFLGWEPIENLESIVRSVIEDKKKELGLAGN